MDEIVESLNNVEDMRKSLQEVSNTVILNFKKIVSFQNKKLSIIFGSAVNSFYKNLESKVSLNLPDPSVMQINYNLCTHLESWTLIKNSLLELEQKNMQKIVTKMVI